MIERAEEHYERHIPKGIHELQNAKGQTAQKIYEKNGSNGDRTMDD